MHIALLLPVVLAMSASASAAGTASCDKANLHARLRGAEEVATPPKLNRTQGSWIARLGLIDSPLAMDAFKYDAVVESSTGRAWLVQFGGFAGDVRWFGPVHITPDALLECPEVKTAILFSERADAKAKARAASAGGQ
ncbi:hypothetical protein ABT392_05410 [Paucibacter sp. JuS9]|uniref:hypothetical protein n=1 Tax=Paucibacter sp. JuS9 TaxID=3228748 RepID=UPI003756C8AE